MPVLLALSWLPQSTVPFSAAVALQTGTPMQNDLDEFFAMADFVNPGLLGSLKSFRSKCVPVLNLFATSSCVKTVVGEVRRVQRSRLSEGY